MNDQKFKKVSYKIDYAPKWKKPYNWRSLAAWVSIIAMIAVISVVIGCEFTWRDFCG